MKVKMLELLLFLSDLNTAEGSSTDRLFQSKSGRID